jgi:transcriptional regulator with XRE-family HTH domain
VGLEDGTRRRTPGLRREEVALLAGVGVSWYVWLEQGRDIHVSEGVLERLSHALRLDSAERSHLFELAQGRPPRHTVLPTDVVSDTLRRGRRCARSWLIHRSANRIRGRARERVDVVEAHEAHEAG